jgi:hypothetical protein
MKTASWRCSEYPAARAGVIYKERKIAKNSAREIFLRNLFAITFTPHAKGVVSAINPMHPFDPIRDVPWSRTCRHGG